jgi:hypothetical protein
MSGHKIYVEPGFKSRKDWSKLLNRFSGAWINGLFSGCMIEKTDYNTEPARGSQVLQDCIESSDCTSTLSTSASKDLYARIASNPPLILSTSPDMTWREVLLQIEPANEEGGETLRYLREEPLYAITVHYVNNNLTPDDLVCSACCTSNIRSQATQLFDHCVFIPELEKCTSCVL